jgi:hypothetical protein
VTKTKTAIFSFIPMSDNSMVASARIAKWVEKKLAVGPVIWKDEIGDLKKLETLVIVNGAYGFSKVLEPLSHAIYGAKNVVWIQNDYTIIPPKDDGEAESPFRKAFVRRKSEGKNDTVFWSTCHKWSTLPGSHYVNWNQLTFDQDYDEAVIAKRRKKSTPTLFYYGSFRSNAGMRKKVVQVNGKRSWDGHSRTPFVGKNGRDAAFDHYFSGPLVKTVVSSPADQFAEKYPNITTIPPIRGNFFDTLGSHGLGLYIEDVRSHEEFHSPANRFYEMLSAGLPMVFEPGSVKMLAKAGFDVAPYVVSGPADAKKMMERRELIGREQRDKWVNGAPRMYRKELEKQFNKARGAIGL